MNTISPALWMVTLDLMEGADWITDSFSMAFHGFWCAIVHPTTSNCCFSCFWIVAGFSSQHVAHSSINKESISNTKEHCTICGYDTSKWLIQNQWILGRQESELSNASMFMFNVPNSADSKVIDEVVQITRILESQHNLTWFPCNGLLLFLETSPEMSHRVTLKHGGHDPHGFKVSELRRSMVENKELDQSQVGQGRIHGIPTSNSQSRKLPPKPASTFDAFFHFQCLFGVVLGSFWRLKKTLFLSQSIFRWEYSYIHYIVIQSAYMNVYICVLYVYKDAYTFIYNINMIICNSDPNKAKTAWGVGLGLCKCTSLEIRGLDGRCCRRCCFGSDAALET